ncbi:MAG TPA: small ribosomal subunit Rsm22 family protein [Bryobacteraceae bacterium]|nr:small ribosomal subunit Rsm22 family protein [Bryobacteraceae bacterium]
MRPGAVRPINRRIVDDGDVQLPEPVKRRIEERADAVGFPALARAAATLSETYRAGRPAAITEPDRLAAYLVTRMPATYAAAHAVLGEVRRMLGERAVATVLDIGAGAGAASLAARHWFPGARLTLIERHGAVAEAAREWLPDATILKSDATRMETLPPHDLVMAAYSFAEMGATGDTMGARMWRAARVALAAIEPGTPRGFGVIRELRRELLAAEAHMLAPCPGAMECPMAGEDWCHFAARVERSSLHRRVKGGSLGYEDEKYSYVALAREPAVLPEARVIRHPQHQPGLVVLEVCTAQGLRQRHARKRDREQFRAARQAAWGDVV